MSNAERRESRSANFHFAEREGSIDPKVRLCCVRLAQTGADAASLLMLTFGCLPYLDLRSTRVRG